MSSVVDAVPVWILLWSYSQLAWGGCILDVVRHCKVDFRRCIATSIAYVISCLNLVHVRIAIRFWLGGCLHVFCFVFGSSQGCQHSFNCTVNEPHYTETSGKPRWQNIWGGGS